MKKNFRTTQPAESVAKALELAIKYPVSLLGGINSRKLFENVKTYFMFMGYPRSGHSLIGSLLDAHQNIICAHELGVLKYILARFSKRQIFYLLLENSKAFTKKGRTWMGYQYKVPNQWQGKFNCLKIIGDKQGCGATLRLKIRPWLLQRLRDTIAGEIKFFHVLRNPYDNITTIANRRNINLMDSINIYFSLSKTVENIKKELDMDEYFEFRFESFVENPNNLLKEICIFLGVEATNSYLNDCSNIVFKAPRKTRHTIQWNSELIDIVKERISQFSFLQGYSYEN